MKKSPKRKLMLGLIYPDEFKMFVSAVAGIWSPNDAPSLSYQDGEVVAEIRGCKKLETQLCWFFDGFRARCDHKS